eukprot:5346528-Prymnesium_polylepis.1
MNVTAAGSAARLFKPAQRRPVVAGSVVATRSDGIGERLATPHAYVYVQRADLLGRARAFECSRRLIQYTFR